MLTVLIVIGGKPPSTVEIPAVRDFNPTKVIAISRRFRVDGKKRRGRIPPKIENDKNKINIRWTKQ